MVKQCPQVRKTKINDGQTAFVVDARVKGRGERKYFQDFRAAKVYAESVRVRFLNEGRTALVDDELAEYGWTVRQAIDFALEYLRRQAKAESLTTAIETFLAAKKDSGVSSRYHQDLKLRLKRFVAQFPAATTATITTADIDTFLRGLKRSPVTANTFRRDLHTFFSWCVDHDLIAVNPVERSQRFKAKTSPVQILTPQQFARLLENADASIRAGVALAGFCGVRQAEIERLEWSAVDLRQHVVVLEANVTKTASRRTVSLPSTAIAWLKPLQKKDGRIFPDKQSARKYWDLARLRAGFGPFDTQFLDVRHAHSSLSPKEREALVPWPPNALRHSAISYRLALRPGDAAKAYAVKAASAAAITGFDAVAYEVGNSSQVIKTHYLSLAKPDTARSWFGIFPAK
ncbi:MAG: tyrosine-type recombinase/integrase [Chthoniobacterales bacterium]|nr:tyrosine-type recombinase/integrase [Chthoniobacterales bacterium]